LLLRLRRLSLLCTRVAAAGVCCKKRRWLQLRCSCSINRCANHSLIDSSSEVAQLTYGFTGLLLLLLLL
jgi:hypothetical protein